MILANEEALTRPYQYYVTVCLSVPPTKQFCEAPVITVQWFVCLSVAMTTSQGYGYGTQSIDVRWVCNGSRWVRKAFWIRKCWYAHIGDLDQCSEVLNALGSRPTQGSKANGFAF